MQVFELGGDVVPDDMAYGVMRLIAEGAGQDDAGAMVELRYQAVTSYLRLLNKPNLPDVMLKVRLAPAALHAAVMQLHASCCQLAGWLLMGRSSCVCLVSHGMLHLPQIQDG